MVAPLLAGGSQDPRVLVGPDTADDAGVYRFGDRALVVTADFITPIGDDPFRFGKIAAMNSISDVYAMGGRPLLALNLCCFPENLPVELGARILEGGAAAIAHTGAVLLGGHSVRDEDLKYGLCVVGEADPDHLLTNAGAHPGERLILTKPLGTGVLINANRGGELDDAGLEPALVAMERSNAAAAEIALRHGCRAATDVTGFGIAGHALELAQASNVVVTLHTRDLPVHEAFADLVARGVGTRGTRANRAAVESRVLGAEGLDDATWALLCDPQTSGGLLIAAAPERVEGILADLTAAGDRGVVVGRLDEGSPALQVG